MAKNHNGRGVVKKHPWRDSISCAIDPRVVDALRAAKRPKEAKVQVAIVKYLRLAGWLVIPKRQIPTPGRAFPASEEGISDLLCTKPPDGRSVAIEVKRDKAAYEQWAKQDNPKVKSHRHAIQQRAFGAEMRRRGGLFYCIYSVEQAEKIVRDLRGGK